MSNTLLGVIIGGLIGSIIPLATLLLGHYRWKREAKLEYLKSERVRQEAMFEKNIKQLADCMANDSYSSDVISDFMILMPERVSEEFVNFMHDPDKTEAKCRRAYGQVKAAMTFALAAIDTDIMELVSDKSLHCRGKMKTWTKFLVIGWSVVCVGIVVVSFEIMKKDYVTEDYSIYAPQRVEKKEIDGDIYLGAVLYTNPNEFLSKEQFIERVKGAKAIELQSGHKINKSIYLYLPIYSFVIWAFPILVFVMLGYLFEKSSTIGKVEKPLS